MRTLLMLIKSSNWSRLILLAIEISPKLENILMHAHIISNLVETQG